MYYSIKIVSKNNCVFEKTIEETKELDNIKNNLMKEIGRFEENNNNTKEQITNTINLLLESNNMIKRDLKKLDEIVNLQKESFKRNMVVQIIIAVILIILILL